MPKGNPPAWTAKDCRFDGLVVAAMKQPGQPLIYRGVEDADRAADVRRGIYRCARHRGVSVQVTWPYRGEVTSRSANWPPDKVKGTYEITLTVFRKSQGRKHVVQTQGTDRSQWHYNPRARNQKEAS